jgi:hypothetical protein
VCSGLSEHLRDAERKDRSVQDPHLLLLVFGIEARLSLVYRRHDCRQLLIGLPADVHRPSALPAHARHDSVVYSHAIMLAEERVCHPVSGIHPVALHLSVPRSFERQRRASATRAHAFAQKSAGNERMSLIANTVARIEIALRSLDARVSALEHGSLPATACTADVEHKLARYECDKCKLEHDLEEVKNSISSGMKKERSIIEAVLDQKVGVLVDDALTGDKMELAAGTAMEKISVKVSATAASTLELASSLDSRMQTLEAKLSAVGSKSDVEAAIEQLEPSPVLDDEATVDAIEMISIDPATAPKGRSRVKAASK